MLRCERAGWHVAVMLCVFGVSTADAGLPLDEYTSRITAELREINPDAAELFARANAARAEEEMQTAEQLYREVLELEPGFQHASRRLCGVLSWQGRHDEALSFCREAFDAAQLPENLSQLIYVLASSPEATDAELDEALNHAQVLFQEHEADQYRLGSVCQAALVNLNRKPTVSQLLLRQCSAGLTQVAPEDWQTHYLLWTVAMIDSDFDAARKHLAVAQRTGMPEALLTELSGITDEATPWYSTLVEPALKVGAAWIAGLLMLLALGAVLSRMALRAASRPPSLESGESAGLDAALRKTYRTVLWLCCAYYYLSIPVVLIVVVGAGGGLLYMFVMLGRIPIKLLLIVLVVMLVTVWAVLKSIFVRARDEDPGERLDLAEHPRLRGVLDEVAGEIGTRPVDNVYVTPGTDLAVMERGGLLRQLRGGSERCLILGVGVLDGMKLGPFKAILAHEYGHFSNRDTAGGGFALAVRRSLLTMAFALAKGGAATWYNPAWWFLNGFYRVFLRISQGASRLQEVLADRWAAFAYGAKQFELGLRHVIERSIRFTDHSQSTLDELVERGKPLANFYTYVPARVADEVQMRSGVEEAIRAAPSPYDSHPSPSDRFEWVHALHGEPSGILGDAEEEAWHLFADRGRIEMWMTDHIRANLETHHGISIPAGS